MVAVVSQCFHHTLNRRLSSLFPVLWVVMLNHLCSNSLPSKIRQSMVAVVYVDQQDKERRAGSFIVSGLVLLSEHSDKAMVTYLCSSEFRIQVDVINTKRLGKLAVSSTAKIQPLLVSLKDADQAKCIISSAHQLRQSSVPGVRENVFVNANRTKAEASAAYELRCRHREVIARRTTTTDNPSCINNSSFNYSPVEFC
jgi:hypothetical protein